MLNTHFFLKCNKHNNCCCQKLIFKKTPKSLILTLKKPIVFNPTLIHSLSLSRFPISHTEFRRFMATSRLIASYRFPASARVDCDSYVGLRAPSRISYARIVTVRPPGCLAVRANEDRASVVIAATSTEKEKKRYPGESKGFVEEMRFVAMRLHTRDQAREGEKESKSPEEGPVAN